MSGYATPRDLIPEPFRVLGTMLRPFSLGHHLLLQKVESRFANFNFDFGKDRATAIACAQSSDPDELAIAVFICAAPYREGLREIEQGDWRDSFNAWLKRLKPKWHQRTRFDHDHEAAIFCEYLCAGYHRPPVWRHDGGVSLSAPWELLLKCRLVQAGFDEARVLNKYLPEAWYDYFTVSELRQVDNIRDVKEWKKVFWTRDDQQKWEAK